MKRTVLVTTALVVGVACGPVELGGPVDDFATAGSENTQALDIELGSGVEEFESVDDGQSLPIVGGLQGGTHVWGAVRVAGVSDDRVRLVFGLTRVDSDELDGELGPLRVKLARSDEDGWWEVSGLTVSLDDPNLVDDTDCELTVTATDADGRQASDSRRVTPRLE
jgi:hypothetical protein